jgi:hypothetical protein
VAVPRKSPEVPDDSSQMALVSHLTCDVPARADSALSTAGLCRSSCDPRQSASVTGLAPAITVLAGILVRNVTRLRRSCADMRVGLERRLTEVFVEEGASVDLAARS